MHLPLFIQNLNNFSECMHDVCADTCVRALCNNNWTLLRTVSTSNEPCTFEAQAQPYFIIFDDQIEKQTRKQEQGMILTIPKSHPCTASFHVVLH
jgi:hypothetical protein